MLFKKFLNFILGYVRISIEGYFIERFMNICISKRILLSKTERKKSTVLQANIGISDFIRIRKIARITKCKIKIVSKNGIPFIIKKYRKRKIFAIFLGMMMMLIFILSNFIWNIEIICEEDINKEELMNQLKEYGLSVGKSKKTLDTKEIINHIRLKREDISWIGISIKGTNTIVEVVKSVKKPVIVKENEYCNIVANKEGIITKISAQNGTALVKPGDIIKKGTVLVAGYIQGKYTGTRYVHAMGLVEGIVWHSKKEKVSLNQDVEVKTGATERRYSVNINNFKINLWKKLSNFQKYDTMIESNKITLFKNFYLPINIDKITCFEKITQNIVYEKEELKQNTIRKIEKEIEEEIENKDNIQDKKMNYYEGEGYIEIEVIYEVKEVFGAEEKIIF